MTATLVARKTAVIVALVIGVSVSAYVATQLPRRTIQFESESLPSGVNKVLIGGGKNSFSGAIHPDGISYFGSGLWRFPWEPTSKQVKIISKDGVVMNSPVHFPIFGRFSIRPVTIDAPNKAALDNP